MKKFIICLMAVSLSACTALGESVSRSDVAAALFTQAVDSQCRSELNKQELYQMASLLMSYEQKNNLENKVCGCVAKEAPKHISFEEIAKAAFDADAQTRLAIKTVAKTITPCAKKLIGY